MAVLWRCNSRTAVSVLKVSETNRTIWGKGKGQGQGKGQGRGREDVCADLQDLELKEGREGTQQHGPGAILEGAIGSCRDPTSFS